MGIKMTKDKAPKKGLAASTLGDAYNKSVKTTKSLPPKSLKEVKRPTTDTIAESTQYVVKAIQPKAQVAQKIADKKFEDNPIDAVADYTTAKYLRNKVIPMIPGVDATNRKAVEKEVARFHKKHGSPKIRDTNNNMLGGIIGKNRAMYNPLSNTTYLPIEHQDKIQKEFDKQGANQKVGGLGIYADEVAHAKQTIESGGAGSFLGKYMVDGIKGLATGSSPYDNKGALEYNAHEEIQPQLKSTLKAIPSKIQYQESQPTLKETLLKSKNNVKQYNQGTMGIRMGGPKDINGNKIKKSDPKHPKNRMNAANAKINTAAQGSQLKAASTSLGVGGNGMVSNTHLPDHIRAQGSGMKMTTQNTFNAKVASRGDVTPEMSGALNSVSGSVGNRSDSGIGVGQMATEAKVKSLITPRPVLTDATSPLAAKPYRRGTDGVKTGKGSQGKQVETISAADSYNAKTRTSDAGKNLRMTPRAKGVPAVELVSLDETLKSRSNDDIRKERKQAASNPHPKYKARAAELTEELVDRDAHKRVNQKLTYRDGTNGIKMKKDNSETRLLKHNIDMTRKAKNKNAGADSRLLQDKITSDSTRLAKLGQPKYRKGTNGVQLAKNVEDPEARKLPTNKQSLKAGNFSSNTLGTTAKTMTNAEAQAKVKAASSYKITKK
jgi:hypothetical protein